MFIKRFWSKCLENLILYSKWRCKNRCIQLIFRSGFGTRRLNNFKIFFFIIANRSENSNSDHLSMNFRMTNFSSSVNLHRDDSYSEALRKWLRIRLRKMFLFTPNNLAVMLIDVFSLNTFAIVNRKRSLFESDLTTFFALGEEVEEIPAQYRIPLNAEP